MPINARLPFISKRLFKLRSILLLVMLTVLALPLGGLYFFRIYENELVQQTERELIVQAAALSAGFRLIARNYQVNHAVYGRFLPSASVPDSRFHPIVPVLNLFDRIEPRRPDPMPSVIPVDPIAQTIGATLKPVMFDTQQISLAGMRLLDVNGTVIGGREEEGLSLAHIPEVQRALQGFYASVIRQRISDQPPPPLYSISRGTLIRLFVAFPVIEQQHLQGVIYLSRTPENILKHLYAVKEKVFVGLLTLLLLTALLVALVSAAISRPIRELILQTQRVRQGKQQYLTLLENPVTFEIAQLSDSFAEMSNALTERNDYLKRFATHMSHEIKTPLTAIQGALELLRDHIDTMPVTQRNTFFDNVMADTQRLRLLVNRLLELARADATEISAKTCELTVVLSNLKSRFADRKLKLIYAELPAVRLAIAEDVLTMALFNLLENSCQHGASQVEIFAEVQDKVIRIILQDNGNGISADNQAKIFTPFFTTRRHSGGTGLGLAITASLLKAYQGQIELLDTERGAAFRLLLYISEPD
jgi:signal transduction histidine kinase